MTDWLFPEDDVDPEDVTADDVEVGRLEADAIDPGTKVLVVGPALTGKRRIGLDILGGSPSQTAGIVSTKQSARRVNESFRAAVDDPDAWDLSIVDCTGGHVQRREPTGYTVKNVTAPHDLTGIGIRLSGILQRWHHDGVEEPRMQLHTLSTLLMYTDLKRVFRFLHVVLSRIERVGAVSVCTLDTSSRQSDSFDRLAHLFDAVVEVRDDDGRAFRVRGGDFGPQTWTPF